MDIDFELDLGVGRVQGEYFVRVIRAPAGGEPSAMIQLDADALLQRLTDLERTVLLSALPARGVLIEEPVRRMGRELFEAIFTGPIDGSYRASLGAAQATGGYLRLVLRLSAPELAALPWETLFDPLTESYLCRDEPLLRRIPASDFHPHPLKVKAPLRILGIISSPAGSAQLNVDAEKHNLERALSGPLAAGLVELVWAAGADWQSLSTNLHAGPWHVVHFIGHGDYDSHSGEGRIELTAPDGTANMIEASRLVNLLSLARPAPQLVVLNSCSGGQSGTQDLFSGTAAALVRGGISAVTAMQFKINDIAAIAFSTGFYTAIAFGRSVDEAARSGRIHIEQEIHGTLEWVTPVVYTRGTANLLFKIPTPHISPLKQKQRARAEASNSRGRPRK